ncbi:MAG: YqgE/AlgH family protein [bacterium]|nr:YqgE/AlgH family protein [bacterium]
MGQNGNMTAGARSLAILLGVTMCAGAQDALVREPAAGRYLVAQRDLLDPNFSETVILLVHYSEKEAMGLVVDRPTKVTVSRLFQEMEEARGRRDPVYLGGPVAVNGVVGLLRSSKDPAEGAEHVTEDVYLISSEGTLKKAIERGAEASEFRIFLGYAGWGARQLDGELARGSWHVFKADVSVAFDADPEGVWKRFIQRTNLQIALTDLFRPAAVR